MTTSLNNRKQLKQAGRPLELLVGWICALISISFAALLVYLVYIVGWRNPRQYGSHDLLNSQTLAVFSILLLIAVGFSVFASRLLLKTKSKQRLMSPLVLRAWGSFFALGSIVMIVDCVAKSRCLTAGFGSFTIGNTITVFKWCGLNRLISLS